MIWDVEIQVKNSFTQPIHSRIFCTQFTINNKIISTYVSNSEKIKHVHREFDVSEPDKFISGLQRVEQTQKKTWTVCHFAALVGAKYQLGNFSSGKNSGMLFDFSSGS